MEAALDLGAGLEEAATLLVLILGCLGSTLVHKGSKIKGTKMTDDFEHLQCVALCGCFGDRYRMSIIYKILEQAFIFKYPNNISRHPAACWKVRAFPRHSWEFPRTTWCSRNPFVACYLSLWDAFWTEVRSRWLAQKSYLRGATSLLGPLCTLPHTTHQQSRCRTLLEVPKHSKRKVAMLDATDWSLRIEWGHSTATGCVLSLLLAHCSPAPAQEAPPVTVTPSRWPQAMMWGLILSRQESSFSSPVMTIPAPSSFSHFSGLYKKK